PSGGPVSPAAGSVPVSAPPAGHPSGGDKAGPSAPVSPGDQVRSVARAVVPGAQPPGRASVHHAGSAPPPTRPMPRYETPAPARPRARPRPPGAPPPRGGPRPPAPAPPPPVFAGPVSYPQEREPGRVGPLIRAFFITLLLIAVPLISMYISYKVTVHESVIP